MDWQQLAAIKGNSGFAYKLSIIHLSTCVKYSEIHHDYSTQTLAVFLEEAVKRFPPFYIVFTDNHIPFTMKYAHRSERKTAFTKKAESMNIIPIHIENAYLILNLIFFLNKMSKRKDIVYL